MFPYKSSLKTKAPPTSPRNSASIALLLVWISIIGIYYEQVLLVVESWEKLPSHAHGYVVLVVVGFLLWRKRHILGSVAISPSYGGFIVFSIFCVAAFTGEIVSAYVVVQFSVVFMLLSSAWAIMGYSLFRTILGPMCFLFFAIPFGQDILPILMDWTANATVAGLRASGIPVLQQDRNFVIPSGSWSVIEACAGVRYLFTSFFVGSLFAYLTYQRWHKRLGFVIAIVLLSLLANWLRAYVIVMVAHLTNNQWGLGMSHLTLGWIIFALIVWTTFAIGSRWSDPVPNSSNISVTGEISLSKVFLVAVVTASMAFSWNQGAHYLLNHEHSTNAPMVLDMTASLGGLEIIDPPLLMVSPAFFGATGIHKATYAYAGGAINVYIAYYGHQNQDHELININNLLEPTKTWEWRGHHKINTKVDSLPILEIQKYTQEGVIALVSKIYWVGGFKTQNDVYSKLFQGLNLLRGKRADGAAVVLSASGQSEEQASQVLESFINGRLTILLDDLDHTMAKSY